MQIRATVVWADFIRRAIQPIIHVAGRPMRFLKWRYRFMLALMVAAGVALGGCVTTGTTGAGIGSDLVGPQRSSEIGKKEQRKTTGLPLIEVVVPVFDPGIPEDSDTWEEEGIYPELRRAEANRFAIKMKEALDATGAFGRVRVVPDSTATAELYISGKILQSNGEDVAIGITTVDISGRKWFSRDFTHRAKEAFHENIRNKGKDAYDPVFADAAKYIVEQLTRRKADELERLRLLADIRFGESLSEETFSRYLNRSDNRVMLTSAPADNDPALLRIRSIRVRDQLFHDNMQTQYTDFNAKLNESYLEWQKQSLIESKARRKAKSSATAKLVLGAAIAIIGAAAAAKHSDSGGSTAGKVLGTTAAVGGLMAVFDGLEDRQQAQVHSDTLNELGQSIDIEIAPQNIEYEGTVKKLTGNAATQHKQWIAFLKEIYALESTPQRQL